MDQKLDFDFDTMTEEEYVAALMKFYGVDEIEARFIVAQERGETEGDEGVIEEG